MIPFRPLVTRHRQTGKGITPNANKVMLDLISQSTELGLNELAEVFRDAFDADLRNDIHTPIASYGRTGSGSPGGTGDVLG